MTNPSGSGWGTDIYEAKFLPINSVGGIDVPGYPEPATDGFGGYKFKGPKNLTLSLGAPRAVTNVSQGRVNDTIYLPSTDAKTAEFHLSYIDQELFSILATVKRRTDIGLASIFPFGTDKQGLEIKGAFVVSNLAFDDFENSAPQWHNYILPRVRAVVNMPGMDENSLDVTVNLSLGATKKHLWGEAVTIAKDGATQLMGYDYITENPLNVWAWLADGTEDTFLLDPDRPAVADGDALSLWNFTSGTEVTGGITKSTTSIVYGSAPTDGDLLVALYEFEL
jgi:hypothetical protein